MDCRSICAIAILAALSGAPSIIAQTEPPEAKAKLSAQLLETNPSDSTHTSSLRPAKTNPFEPKLKSPAHISKARFVLLSAAVYGAAPADMHQTREVRQSPSWYDTDPLAKPFVRLPAPAYYATGLAMATGVNWLSWKMARSPRWRKLEPIPQLLSISGNLYGFHANHS